MNLITYAIYLAFVIAAAQIHIYSDKSMRMNRGIMDSFSSLYDPEPSFSWHYNRVSNHDQKLHQITTTVTYFFLPGKHDKKSPSYICCFRPSLFLHQFIFSLRHSFIPCFFLDECE